MLMLLIDDPPAPALMSSNRCVVALVPLLNHSSSPVVDECPAKRTSLSFNFVSSPGSVATEANKVRPSSGSIAKQPGSWHPAQDMNLTLRKYLRCSNLQFL